MAICHRSELRVYNRLGGGTPVVIPATNVKWSWKLGGEGYLSCSVDSRAEPLASQPRLLDDCVVKVAIPLTEPGTSLTEVAAYAVRGRNGTLWTGSGGKSRNVTGGSLFTIWSQDAVLHPEGNSIEQMSLPERYFGWMSTIYDPSIDAGQWGTPSANAGKQKDATGVRAGNPDGWPEELGDAYWITRGSTANGTRHLFIANCSVPSACYLTVYFSADETCAVYFGGSLIMQPSASENGYQTISRWSAWVEPGSYRVAIDKTSIVSRGGDGRDPVLLAVATNDDEGEVQTPLLFTNTSQWQVYTTDPDGGTVPSLTPGAIVLELRSQAMARGVDTWSAITPDFTSTTDSDGKVWPIREERAWRIGYDRHLDMIEGLGDQGLACEVTPNLTLKGWSARGTDRSATVTLATLDEISTVEEAGTGVEATYLPVETQDGWVIVQNPTAATTYGRRESALSLGNAPSTAQGKRLGQKVLDERLAVPETERTIKFYARAGSVPFQDFFLGDTVTLVVGSSTTKGVVLDLAVDQQSVEGIMAWTAKVSGDGVSGETITGRFVSQVGMALADGGIGSLVGDAVGAAIFATTRGSATASGGTGSLVGVEVSGAAIFRSVAGSAVASGEVGRLDAPVIFATSVGSATASGANGYLKGDNAIFGTETGSAVASGGVGSLSNAVPAAGTATGGTITYAGGYKIHSFTSGTTNFVVSGGSISGVEALIVAGGGAGGSRGAGGGGAGGLISLTNQTVTAGTYSVVVGSGGPSHSTNAAGADGGNSSALGSTAIGGGGGGAYNGSGIAGRSGGSGGGSGYGNYGNASGTSGQGNSGGAGGCGGGGGAGAAGSPGSDGGYGGNGGAGVQSSITGTALWYAGGGGGSSSNTNGNGGSGVGGAGAWLYDGGAGMANRGGGGGGIYSNGHNSGPGGSGVVVIRYPSAPPFDMPLNLLLMGTGSPNTLDTPALLLMGA